MSKYVHLYRELIFFLQKKLNPKQFLIFSSILVGLSAGLAAVILKTFVHYIHIAITHDYHIRYQYVLYLLFPAVGILLTVWFVQKHLKGDLGRGSANILYSIAKKASFLPQHQMYSHIITSGITVGFGGSAGLESPIVTTGSAIGSNYAKTYHVNYQDRTLLLACGAAAGIAAAFNAPIAGVLFALEVLLTNVNISLFIPLIISAATGALLSKVILADDIPLKFQWLLPFNYHNIGYYILLGILAGFVSVYYARLFPKIENFFIPRKQNIYINALVGGLMLAVLILFFPSLMGEGYDSVKQLSNLQPEKIYEHSILAFLTTNKWTLALLIIATMLFKVLATAITLGSGGNGGNFAPSLFVGAYLGFGFSFIVNLLGLSNLPQGNFTIVAMAGILTGVFHAPLTGIFLIAEITGGYELMIPLMIVSACSYTVVKYFETYSMDVKKLAEKGHLAAEKSASELMPSDSI